MLRLIYEMLKKRYEPEGSDCKSKEHDLGYANLFEALTCSKNKTGYVITSMPKNSIEQAVYTCTPDPKSHFLGVVRLKAEFVSKEELKIALAG